jgi:hypothetical protein
MSIGDWSDDGHGKYKDFIVQSNMPVEVVREAHFAMNDVTGINIENICNEYEETLVSAETTKIIRDLGFEFDYVDNGEADVYPEEMAQLWLFLLQKVNPELKLEIIKDEIPDFHFYGFDAKNRHIGQVGYGLFS